MHLLGGALIGLSAALLMLFQGRVAGVSGLIGAFLYNPIKVQWQTLFLVGLVAGGILARYAMPGAFPESIPQTLHTLFRPVFSLALYTTWQWLHQWPWNLRHQQAIRTQYFRNSNFYGYRFCDRLYSLSYGRLVFMKHNITSLLLGLLFGIGLTISGMTQPAKVIGFLDLLET